MSVRPNGTGAGLTADKKPFAEIGNTTGPKRRTETVNIGSFHQNKAYKKFFYGQIIDKLTSPASRFSTTECDEALHSQ